MCLPCEEQALRCVRLRSCSIVEICWEESASPTKRCPGGGGWVAPAGPEGRLTCLAPCHRAAGPTSHVAGGWKVVSPAEGCAWGGAARDHLTSAGASGPSAHVVDLELGSEVGPGGRVERIWRERELDSES